MTISSQVGSSHQARGIAFGLMGGLCISFGGPLVRLIEQAEGWQILTYRSGAFTVTLLLLIVAQYGWRSMDVIKNAFTPIGLGVAVTIGSGFCFYLFALLNTTVANTVFVISMGPLITAAIAWPVLGERLSLKTLLILLFALVGVAVMLTGAVSAGRLLGNVFAFGAVLTFAIFVILCRLARDRDMLAATCLGGFFATCFSAYMAPTLIILPMDYIYALLLGIVQVGLGFSFITWASRYIPAAEVSLLALLETVLGPIWTWMVVGELPASTTLIGGAIVLACVVIHAVSAVRQTRRKVSVFD